MVWTTWDGCILGIIGSCTTCLMDGLTPEASIKGGEQLGGNLNSGHIVLTLGRCGSNEGPMTSEITVC